MILCSQETINHITAAQTSLPTLKEPNIPWLVFKGGIDVVGNPPPVTGRQCWVTALQMPVPDSPHVSRLKEEQLPSDHRHGIKVRLAGVGLGMTQITCSHPHANVSRKSHFIAAGSSVKYPFYCLKGSQNKVRRVFVLLKVQWNSLSYKFYQRK